MYILIDIGNSTIEVATTNEAGQIEHTWRFKTMKEGTVSFFRHELWNGMKKYRINAADIQSTIISSVVPEVNDDIFQAVNDLTGKPPHFFSLADANGIIDVKVDAPSQLGKDRLADAIGAVTQYGAPAIILDLGTATTVGLVTADRTFIGGMIIPGVKTALTALCTRASQLPTISVEKPNSIVGRNTLECMQSGIVYGTVAMLDGIIDRLLPYVQKNGEPVHIIATGGMAKYIVPLCTHKVTIDYHLQIKGLLAVV